MAKIKYSALVSAVSGKLNGSVMAKNRAGDYIRNKGVVLNPQTDAQVAVRSRLAFFSAGWKALTQDQRNAWLGAVSDWMKTNIFGDSVKPTGNNLYVAVNSNIQNSGGSPVSVPPAKVGADALTELSVAVDVSDAEVEITTGALTVPVGHALVVEATEMMSPGALYAKNKFRQISVIDAGATTPANVWSAYVAKFGTPVAGMRISVRCKYINKTTGEVSLPLNATTIVTA